MCFFKPDANAEPSLKTDLLAEDWAALLLFLNVTMPSSQIIM